MSLIAGMSLNANVSLIASLNASMSLIAGMSLNANVSLIASLNASVSLIAGMSLNASVRQITIVSLNASGCQNKCSANNQKSETLDENYSIGSE